MNIPYDISNHEKLKSGCTLEELVNMKIPTSRYDPLYHRQKYPAFSLYSKSNKPLSHDSPKPISDRDSKLFKIAKPIPANHQTQSRFNAYIKAEHKTKIFVRASNPSYDLADIQHQEFVNDISSLGKMLATRYSSFRASRLPNNSLSNEVFDRASPLNSYNSSEAKEKPVRRAKTPDLHKRRKQNFSEISMGAMNDIKTLLKKSENSPSSPSDSRSFDLQFKRKSEELSKDVYTNKNTSRIKTKRCQSVQSAFGRRKPPNLSLKSNQELNISSVDSSVIHSPLAPVYQSTNTITSPNYQSVNYSLYEYLYR